MPALSYATAYRDGQRFGVLNAVFQFNVDAEKFQSFKEAIRRQNPQAKFNPLPMAHTSPVVAVAGVGNESCIESTDLLSGKPLKQCVQLTHRPILAANGPTLGEQIGVSTVLTPAGVEIFPKLLAGGSGVMLNLEYVYMAALPAFKAKIEADYKKIYESYAWYAGYHDGICTDIAISDFWEKTTVCQNNGLDGFGKACGVKITYTDSHGNPVNNIFDILPAIESNESTKAWYAQHRERVNTLWNSTDGLRKDFENKFLAPINGRPAEVSKTPTRGFALRADRSVTEQQGSFVLERDMLGSVGPKSSTVIAYTTCIKVDGETGSVDLSNIGRCSDYYQGKVTAAEMTPVVTQFDSASNKPKNKVLGTIDWE
jgi:hypothetical protein